MIDMIFYFFQSFNCEKSLLLNLKWHWHALLIFSAADRHWVCFDFGKNWTLHNLVLHQPCFDQNNLVWLKLLYNFSVTHSKNIKQMIEKNVTKEMLPVNVFLSVDSKRKTKIFCSNTSENSFIQASISSTLYGRIFRTKFWRQIVQSWNVTRESCVICFHTKNIDEIDTRPARWITSNGAVTLTTNALSQFRL